MDPVLGAQKIGGATPSCLGSEWVTSKGLLLTLSVLVYIPPRLVFTITAALRLHADSGDPGQSAGGCSPTL